MNLDTFDLTDKQIFHCFGCGVGGNVYTFLTKIYAYIIENKYTPEGVQYAQKQYSNFVQYSGIANIHLWVYTIFNK